MRLNGLVQVRCAPIVQEEHSLAESPQRRRAELVRAGVSLTAAQTELGKEERSTGFAGGIYTNARKCETNGRLSCRIKMTEELDGTVIRLPGKQR